MRHRFVFLAILAWGSLAHALDLGAILNNSISNELKRQMDSGLSGIFRSVEEAVIGVNNSNLQIQGASNGQVVMYSLASCGYCNAARKYMVSQGISFIEKDVGRDATAKAEFRNIDEKGGVPLLIMGKHKVRGFSESSFKQTYAKFQADQDKDQPGLPVANSPAPSVSPGYKSGELLVARIAKVKLLSDADSSAGALGLLAKNEEVIYLGEARGAYLKVRGSDSEGWVDKALLAKP